MKIYVEYKENFSNIIVRVKNEKKSLHLLATRNNFTEYCLPTSIDLFVELIA